MARRVRGLLPALLLLAVGVAACGGDAGGRDGAGDGEAEESAAARGGAPAAGESGASAPEKARAGPDSLGERRPLRAFRVRIRNGGRDTAVVSADAGAGARTLDTVPPADSSRVRVETRAGLIELRARADDGNEVARVRYDLERPAGDTLLEFEVPPPTSGDSAGG